MTEANSDQAGKMYAWLFEAKGIQRWLFSSGRLRDVVGGSDLVSRIASSDGNDLIGLAVTAQKLSIIGDANQSKSEYQISFSRRAGAAFCAHCLSAKTLYGLRRQFLLRFVTALPGLEYEDNLGSGEGEIASRNAAYETRNGARSNSIAGMLPLGRPVFALNPRSGLPKTGEVTYENANGESRVDPLDRMLSAQRRRADTLQKRSGTVQNGQKDHLPLVMDGAAERLHRYAADNQLKVYPRNLNGDDGDTADNPMFPWMENSPDRRIALVHADISGLGEAFQNAKVSNAKRALDLGTEIETAILKAIGAASNQVLLPNARAHDNGNKIVPARPIVVGGDDITVLVRADLALPFADCLLEEIEKETADIHDIPGGLSACAGVAISRAGLPFLTLNALGESLCAFAKTKAKSMGRPWPSLLAFHVHSQSAEEDYGDDINPHLELGSDFLLTGNPYLSGNVKLQGRANYRQLRELARSLNAVSGAFGTIRTIAGELQAGRSENSNALWRRFWYREDRAIEQNCLLKHFKDVLEAVSGKSVSFDHIPQGGHLFDAIELIDLSTPLLAETDKIEILGEDA